MVLCNHILGVSFEEEVNIINGAYWNYPMFFGQTIFSGLTTVYIFFSKSNCQLAGTLEASIYLLTYCTVPDHAGEGSTHLNEIQCLLSAF